MMSIIGMAAEPWTSSHNDNLLRLYLRLLASRVISFVQRICPQPSFIVIRAKQRFFGLHKIRLAGIDAPKKQELGQKTKSALATLAYGEAATADSRKRDRYQREICVMRVKGKDVELGHTAAGLAWWYRHYSKEQSTQERSNYEREENDEQRHRFGVWVSSNPTPPWKWRHGVNEFSSALSG